MKRDYVIIALVAAVSVVLTRTCFPKIKEKTNVVPHIITKYDTVEKLPRWYEDSVKKWKSRKYTTDTIELTVTNTIIDTQWYPVSSPIESRPDYWPLVSYHSGIEFGDTATVTTLNLKTGNLGISRVFVPGILKDIEATDQSEPKLTYAPFPEPKKPPFLYSMKMIGIGAGIMAIIMVVR